MYYCLIDPFDNLYQIDLSEPPETIFWVCVCRGVEYCGRTREIAEQEMVRAVEKNTNYRGYLQIAKHLGVGIRSYGLVQQTVPTNCLIKRPEHKEKLCCFVRDGVITGQFVGAGEK